MFRPPRLRQLSWTAPNRPASTSVPRRGQPPRVDYDADGWQDVWVGLHQWGGRLFRNNGNGTYTRVALNAWPRINSQGGIVDRHDCAFADVDGNGLPDAYCSSGRNQNNYVKGAARDNELWLQTSVGNFTDVGTQWGVGDWCGRGRFAAFFDANGDGWPDLFLGNETPRNVSDPCDNAANGYPNEESKLFLKPAGRGRSTPRPSTGSAPARASVAP